MSTCALYPLFILVAPWLLDAFFGDPEKLPHPVRAIGAYIRWMEESSVQLFSSKKAAGVYIGICVPATVFFLVLCIIIGTASINAWLAMAASCLAVYYCLATRCLGDEALSIFEKLRSGDVPAARQRLSRIVGRDTEQLTEAEIVRATVETVSENTVDGIISPLFYAALGGAPLAMAFKAVSTLDSLIGYKNTKYRDLGWFSARFDDVLNYIPARLCLFLVPLAAFMVPFARPGHAYAAGLRDGRHSPSSNAGFPEACFAGALGIQLGGECTYDGKVSHKPLIGQKDRELETDDIQKSVSLMWFVSALSLAMFTAVFVLCCSFLGGS